MWGHSVPRGHCAVGRGGGVMKVLENAVRDKGGEILVNHEITRIVREQPLNGRVVGVEVKKEGTNLYFQARRAVIVATGGFSLNKKMLERHDPRLRHLPSTYPKNVPTGDAILMCQAIGAAVRGMDYIQCVPMCDPDTGSMRGSGRIFADAFLVNKEGLRFVEEKERRDVISDAILRSPEKTAFAIFDNTILMHEVRELGKKHLLRTLENEIQRKRSFTANTIEKLAEKAGIDVENLLNTVKK